MAAPIDRPESEALPREPLCCVIAVGGQVASGKTTLAHALSERLGAAHVEADRERAALLARARGAHEAEAMRNLAPDLEAQIYTALVHRAEPILARGASVVLDGCFARGSQRAAAQALARRNGAPFLFVECRASAESTHARLAAREEEAAGVGWTWLHDEVSKRWEAPAALAKDECLPVDTSGPLERAVARVAERSSVWRRPLREWDPNAPLEVATFDCWSTLIFEADWAAAHDRRVGAVREAASAAGRPTSREEAAAAFDRGWQFHAALWRDGVASGSREIAADALAALGLGERDDAVARLAEHFQHASHSGRVSEVPGARETLSALARAGVRCALVCDTGLTPGPVVRGHLDSLGLLAPLSVQIFSDEVGFPKPDPRTFRAALAGLGAEPARAVHVGDLRRTDIAGARALGIRSIRIAAHHDDQSNLPDGDAVASSHAELRALLRGGERTPRF